MLELKNKELLSIEGGSILLPNSVYRKLFTRLFRKIIYWL